ncbi:MAG: gamma carbonic anhydrase family protein [Candidatus Omnitrophica bacterium]|nr:gamma carbonic anhydrase family protein [Candidatus Omnitrophota bacterium]
MTNQCQPKLGKNVFIHPSAVVLGQVTLRDYASIWPCAVLRADINRIMIGKYSNIQDLSVVHLESDRGCFVGNYCVVGHRVILHACTLGDGVLVGMGAIILNGARVGDGALIGAGALVTEGERVQPESLYLGAPAKFVRRLTKHEVRDTIVWAKKYARMAQAHQEGMYLPAYSSS